MASTVSGKTFPRRIISLEEALAEDLLQATEVEVLHGEEGAVVGEKPEGRDRMGMGVTYEQVPERLGDHDHGGSGLLELGEPARGPLAQEVPGGGVGHAAEVAVEGAIAEKGAAEAGTRDTHRRWGRGSEIVKTSWR